MFGYAFHLCRLLVSLDSGRLVALPLPSSSPTSLGMIEVGGGVSRGGRGRGRGGGGSFDRRRDDRCAVRLCTRITHLVLGAEALTHSWPKRLLKLPQNIFQPAKKRDGFASISPHPSSPSKTDTDAFSTLLLPGSLAKLDWCRV